ncbi:ribonuclease Z [Vibrio sp. CAU 1672]|uniref:ribonuclease Z n=1 Tax=Vibrio sp. CAU 1672 TaxID=3032594 RepID=UPI0023DBF5B1|nr:ribonuclease Z [Vibrio sp. CAU 1672]MDF2153360.1 ribonuclease Z [Vibrio sp. CAU 1672]
MELYLLGTSSGIPTKTRNVSATALQESEGKGWFLVDCAEGTQHQLLHTPLSLDHLQAICITHIHGDHCYGLPGLLASAGMNNRSKPLTIVAPKGIQQWFAATQQFTKLNLPFSLNYVLAESLPSLTIGQYTIQVIALSHRVPSYGYGFTQSTIRRHLNIEKLNRDQIPRGPLWGQLIRGEDISFQGKTIRSTDYTLLDHNPRKVIIGGDNDTPDLLEPYCKGCQVLIHESTYGDELALRAQEVGHSYAGQVAGFAQRMAIPHLVLTHFSPRYQTRPDAPVSIDQLRQQAQTVYSGQLFLAQDLQHYRLNKRGELALMTTDALPRD